MTREQAVEWIHDPAGGPDDPAQRREFDAWLARDPALRTLHDQQLELLGVLDDWSAPHPSPGFDDALYARIAEEQRKPVGWQAWFAGLLQPRPMLAAATVAAAVLLAVGLPPVQEPVGVVEKATLSVDEVEYYEALDQALEDVDMLLDFEAFSPEAEANRS